MSDPERGEVTPERLAELAEGAPALTDAERDAVALMADVRALEEPAPDALRERVRVIAAREPRGGLRGWWESAGRRRLVVAGAPVVAVVVAVAVAIPVLRDDGGSPSAPAQDATAQGAEGATALSGPEAHAPAPVTPQASASRASDAAAADAPDAVLGLKVADPDRLPSTVARAKAAVTDLGGSTVSEEPGAAAGSRVLLIEIPSDRAAEALVQLERLGTAERVPGEAAPPPAPAEGQDAVTLEVTIAP